MEKTEIVTAFGAIAQETRLDALRVLLDNLDQGLPAGDIGRILGIAQNTMSTHLSVLKRAGLVLTQRSGTTIYYRADTEKVWRLVDFLVTDVASQRKKAATDAVQHATIPRRYPMTNRVFNVLFLCTGNSARSILGEAILNQDGGGRFKAYSAGSHPRSEVHPTTITTLTDLGYETEGLRSKSWDEFAAPQAPDIDFIFTVCDNAAGEACPIWPGHPMTAHWGIEDPVAVGGTPFQRQAAFSEAARFLKNRIAAFTALPLASLDKLSLQTKLKQIGQMEGSTTRTEDA